MGTRIYIPSYMENHTDLRQSLQHHNVHRSGATGRQSSTQSKVGRLSEFLGNAAAKTKEGIEENWKLGWDGSIVRGPIMVRKVQGQR